MGHRFGCPRIKKVIFTGMFVRKKKNPSGIVSVQIIDKSNGRYVVVKTVGSSADAPTIESLYL